MKFYKFLSAAFIALAAVSCDTPEPTPDPEPNPGGATVSEAYT